MADKCITLKLTDAQRDAVERVTGRRVESVTLDVHELERRDSAAEPAAANDADAIVWECLNPYP